MDELPALIRVPQRMGLLVLVMLLLFPDPVLWDAVPRLVPRVRMGRGMFETEVLRDGVAVPVPLLFAAALDM